MKKLLFYFIILSGIFFAPVARAAIFSLESSVSEIRPNDELTVSLFLDTQGAEINAVEGKILFPLNFLEIKQISDGNSLINLWAQRPAFNLDSGAVNFSGIIPGGYLGKGLMLSVIFKAKNLGNSWIYLSDAQALLNDGLGSPALVSSTGFEFLISSSAPPVTAIAPSADQERPESFAINLGRDDNLYDSQWFAVFATQDKKSGVNHYEVAESKNDVGSDYQKLRWQKTASPYVLKNQNLTSYLYVKAVDNENNERMAITPPRYQQPIYKNFLFWCIILATSVLIFYWMAIWRRKKQNQ